MCSLKDIYRPIVWGIWNKKKYYREINEEEEEKEGEIYTYLLDHNGPWLTCLWQWKDLHICDKLSPFRPAFFHEPIDSWLSGLCRYARVLWLVPRDCSQTMQLVQFSVNAFILDRLEQKLKDGLYDYRYTFVISKVVRFEDSVFTSG